MIKEQFINWQVNKENKKEITANAYVKAINKLSEHYSQIIGKVIDIYLIKDVNQLKTIADLYGLKGKYKEIGAIGHGTLRNAIKTLYRYRSNTPKAKKENIIKLIENKPIATYLKFNNNLVSEANEMAKHYQTIYCLERSIRNLIVELMTAKFGENWWQNKVPESVDRNVVQNMKFDEDTGYTKRSNRKIDYTTFGELRYIVKSNWIAFENKFKSYNAFNSIMITLNRLRVPIAHCTPLAEDEVVRLNLAVKDSFRLIY
jgi:Swt1-like HEPN